MGLNNPLGFGGIQTPTPTPITPPTGGGGGASAGLFANPVGLALAGGQLALGIAQMIQKGKAVNNKLTTKLTTLLSIMRFNNIVLNNRMSRLLKRLTLN